MEVYFKTITKINSDDVLIIYIIILIRHVLIIYADIYIGNKSIPNIKPVNISIKIVFRKKYFSGNKNSMIKYSIKFCYLRYLILLLKVTILFFYLMQILQFLNKIIYLINCSKSAAISPFLTNSDTTKSDQ